MSGEVLLAAMIPFEGEFHAARDATKAHASRVGTFTSAEHGRLDGPGIVLEAFGRSNATPAVIAAVANAVCAGVVVPVTSRCPRGRVLPIYGDRNRALAHPCRQAVRGSSRSRFTPETFPLGMRQPAPSGSASQPQILIVGRDAGIADQHVSSGHRNLLLP